MLLFTYPVNDWKTSTIIQKSRTNEQRQNASPYLSKEKNETGLLFPKLQTEEEFSKSRLIKLLF